MLFGVVLIGFILRGAWGFYFAKPVPNVKTYTVMPGGTMNVTENNPIEKKDPVSWYNRFFLGAKTTKEVYGGFETGFQF